MDNFDSKVWQAGVARRVITPREPIWLSGYCNRTSPSQGVLQDIHARALALKDESGEVSVLLSTDLLGFDRAMGQSIARAASERFGIARERFVLNASHSHCAPVTSGLLESYYDLDADNRRVVEEYSQWLPRELIETIGDALENWQPVELAFAQGFAGFGANRRRTHEHARHRPGLTDHDVPVLTARAEGGELMALVFGYACHATVSNGLMLHGDYPGFAQVELENRFPGATALFVTGCGGDINPMPRYRAGQPQIYGNLLADAVQDVVEKVAMEPISGPLRAGWKEVELPLQTPPTYDELKLMVEDEGRYLPGMRRAYAGTLESLKRGEALPTSCPYTIQVWRFGSGLSMIWLTGETVVEYSLRFKELYGWENTWVSAYCNEMLTYIPTERVLAEGGYEGGEGNLQCDITSWFASGIEQVIADGVEELMSATTVD